MWSGTMSTISAVSSGAVQMTETEGQTTETELSSTVCQEFDSRGLPTLFPVDLFSAKGQTFTSLKPKGERRCI